jgi:hypothetical protein
VLAVPCPTCGKRAGAWCIRPSGHKAMMMHAARKAEADRVWEAGRYPPIIRTKAGFAYGGAK